MKRLSYLFAFVLLLPFAALAQAAAPVEGVDYEMIPGGQTWQPAQGRIEVVEVFAYTCPHCAKFEPVLEAWVRKQPADVRFSAVPAAYLTSDPYARAFFAAKRMGVLDRTHDALFDAIHEQQTVPSNASDDELAAFFAGQGVDRAKFVTAMNSPAVVADIRHARDFMLASGLRGTPTLIVDGRYRVTTPGHEDALRVAGQLVAKARAERQAH